MKAESCVVCEATEFKELSEYVPGYALDENGNKICMDCSVEHSKRSMLDTGKTCLYLINNDGDYVLTDWAGCSRFPVAMYRHGSHNIAGSRIDVWFKFSGSWWWGVQYGEQTQICHCKRIKSL